MARAAEACYTEKSLIEVFRDVEDKAEFRNERGKRHPISLILLLYLLGQLIGFCSYRSIQRNLSDEKVQQKIEEFIPLRHGIPSYTTFSRVISQIPPEYLLGEVCDWIWQLLPESEDGQPHYGIDGKALRASVNKATNGNSLYMVNIHNVVLNIFVYMIRVGKKTNERAEIERNIQDIIHGQSCLITMDAMGTGIHMLNLICKEGSNAVLPVKQNQKTLSELISNYLINRIIEESQTVEHHLDLDGFSEDDIPSKVIRNTKCEVVQEDNPNNGPYTSEDDCSVPETASEESAADLPACTPVISDAESNTSCENSPGLSPDESSQNAADTENSSESCDNPQNEAAKSDAANNSAATNTTNGFASGFVFFDNLYSYSKDIANVALNPANKRLAYVWIGDRYVPMVSVHGRFERREYEYIPLSDELRQTILDNLSEDWHNVKGIGLVTRYRATVARDKETKERYYNVTISRTPYILSMESSVEEFAKIVRSHWIIEDPFHHNIDVLFGEDKCTVRKLAGPANVSFMKKLGYNILRVFQENKLLKETGKENSMISIREYLSQHLSILLRFFDNRTRSPFIK